MQAAVPAGKGAMAVVLGLEMDAVGALCDEASAGEVVAPANYNGGGQIAIAGAKSAVAPGHGVGEGTRRQKSVGFAGERAVSLRVDAAGGGRIRTDLQRCRGSARSIIGVITNVEAEVNRSADRVKRFLIEQAVRPVRWEESVRKLDALGCRRAIEIGPGKVLKGLIKRIVPQLEVDNFETPRRPDQS